MIQQKDFILLSNEEQHTLLSNALRAITAEWDLAVFSDLAVIVWAVKKPSKEFLLTVYTIIHEGITMATQYSEEQKTAYIKKSQEIIEKIKEQELNERNIDLEGELDNELQDL